MRVICRQQSLLFTFILFCQGVALASPVETYFPLNHGDRKHYAFELNHTPRTMTLSYSDEPRRTGVFLESDSLDASKVLYRNQDGTLTMPGVIVDGNYLWFAAPLVIFPDHVIQDGGAHFSSVSTSYYGTPINITVKTTVDIAGEVTVPAATYNNCRLVSFYLNVYIAGTSQPIVMKNVWTLAPQVGKIQIEVVDENDRYLDTAELTSGLVAGRNVSTLIERNIITPILLLLLGD